VCTTAQSTTTAKKSNSVDYCTHDETVFTHYNEATGKMRTCGSADFFGPEN